MFRRIWTGGTAPTHLSSTWRRPGTREVSMTSFRTRGTISRDTMKSGTRHRGCAAVHARRRPSHSSGEHGSAGRMLRTGSPHGLHAELGADKPKRAAVEAFDDRAGALRAAANDLGLCATERHPPSTRGAQSRSSLFAARAEDTAVCSTCATNRGLRKIKEDLTWTCASFVTLQGSCHIAWRLPRSVAGPERALVW